MNNQKPNFITRIKNTFYALLTPTPIENRTDLIKKYVWIGFALLSMIGGLIAGIVTVVGGIDGVASPFPLSIFMIWFYCGTASLLPFAITALKSSWKYIVIGYRVGDTFRTTNVTVTNTYGDHYEARATTETKGCLFSIIAFFVLLFLWTGLFSLAGVILAVIKIVRTVRVIKAYRG